MDFAFSEEQEMLRAQARSLLAAQLNDEDVARLSDEGAHDPELWRRVAALGATSLSVPESHGGAGMGFLEEAVLFEELGRALFPGPYFSTVALALPALVANVDVLAPVVEGERTATLAWAEPGGPYSLDEVADVAVRADQGGGGWHLTGDKELVPDLVKVDDVVVAASGGDGVGLWLVERDAATAAGLQTVDGSRPLGRLSLDSTPARLLVEPGRAENVLRSVRRRALAALALEAVGIAQRALDLALQYAGERKQFDKPIGAYQAVSHQIADTYAETELARSISYWAAWCVAEDDDAAEVAVAAAKWFAGEAAVAACERSIQVHGGIGFTWEHILHRLYKRAQWIDQFDGSAPRQRAVVAGLLLGEQV